MKIYIHLTSLKNKQMPSTYLTHHYIVSIGMFDIFIYHNCFPQF